MSIAIDIGFVATKFCTLVVGEKLRKKIATLSNATIVGTLAGSAGTQATNPYALAAAVALGLAPFGLPGEFVNRAKGARWPAAVMTRSRAPAAKGQRTR
jgi:hypothetical protein